MMRIRENTGTASCTARCRKPHLADRPIMEIKKEEHLVKQIRI